jgi:cytochrome c553
MRSLLILILLFASNVFAEDGKTLYQASCIECHSRMTGGDGTVLYQRDDKIVSSLIELHDRVAHCANAAATNWSEADIQAVTDYLNENFYHF